MPLTRRLSCLMLPLLLATVGCRSFFWDKTPPPSHIAQRGVADAEVTEEIVFLDTALVERPFADPFLDREVWESGDEQAIDLELKPMLEDNGIRVGQFGVLPDRLQTLIGSPRACATPRRQRLEPDKQATVVVGAERPQCSFTVRIGAATTLTLEQVKCEFDVVPKAEDDGRVRLVFTPRARHGQACRQALANKDPDGQLRWSVEPAQPTEEFPGLRFEVVVNANEYVAIGTWSEQKGTLGHAWFVPEKEPVQRLLLLRAARTVSDKLTR